MAQSFLKFAHHAGVPEDTILVIDTSPSMDFDDLNPSRLSAALQAASALGSVKAKEYPEDRLGLVTFSGQARVRVPLVEAGSFSPRHPESGGGGTNISAGLRLARQELAAPGCFPGSSRILDWFAKLVVDEPAEPRARGRRVILLSDGCSNVGGNPRRVASALKNCGIQIDCIGVGGSPDTHEFDEDALKAIASTDPGGRPRYCFIHDTQDLIRHFENLGHIRPLAS